MTLTANEALEIGIVDRVAEPGAVAEEGMAVAERFVGVDRVAMESVMRSMDLVELDLAKYLDQAGTGFDQLPK